MTKKYKMPTCPAMPKGPKKKRAEFINEKLKEFYPDAGCALEFDNDPFRLIVMARLSAQCTDKRVNIVAKELFRKFPDAYAMKNAELEEIEEIIKPCGLFHAKAKSIKEMSEKIISDFDGKVPETKEELLSLPGVGEKIANLMMGDCFGEPSIVADTHLIRLSNRFGLVSTDNPHKVTLEVTKLVPKIDRSDFCHRMISLGREHCKAQKTECEKCQFVKK